MTYEEFSHAIESFGLNKKEFANIVGMNYNSVVNWKSKEIPAWVDSWLENYAKAKKV